MNELDGDIRRFLTRLTDAAPDAPDTAALADHTPSPPGRPVARLVGIAAVLALVVVGAVALRQRTDEPSVGAPSTAAAPTYPVAGCALVPLTVPILVGRTLEEAERVAGEPCTGLVLDVRQEPSELPPGSVVGQEPQAGAQTKPGASIVVYIAEASGGATSFATCRYSVTMPDLVGLTRAQAEENLRGWCFGGNARVVEIPAGDEVGRVVNQSPAPGTPVQQGVDVIVSVTGARQVVGSFTLGDGTRRDVELVAGGICISRGDDLTRGCDGLPPVPSPVVVFFGGDGPQDMWGLLDPGLTVRVERDGVAVPVQQTTEPVGGHLAFFGLVPAGGRVTVTVVDASGAVVKRLDDVPR